MRRRILFSKNSSNDGSVEPSKAQTCDVVFANKSTEELVIVSDGDTYWNTYPKSDYVPIGIVVIPGEHGVLKDSNRNNQCGIMSLAPMNCDKPQNGGSKEEFMYWGNNPDITDMINYNKIVTCNKLNTATGSTNISYPVYMPKQRSIGESATWYSTLYAPSPYANDNMSNGGFNSSYSDTTVGTSANCLSDFDGPGNTKKIIQWRGGKDYNTWKPTYDVKDDYPAASCCDMFSTLGTKQGDWYLPACGELGYILPKLYDINDTISKLKSAYGIGVKLDTEYNYWTSTEVNGSAARQIVTTNGSVNSGYKYYTWFVRAFMRL